MKKILISNPRYGSTYATQIFHRYCAQNQPSIRAETLGYHNEFLLKNDGTYTHRLPLYIKIAMIEKQRKMGKELLYQVHSSHLFYEYKDGIVLDWFKEFYKDSEIYILRRKDLWHALLSLIIHWNSDTMPNKKWHKKSDDDIHNLKEWYSQNTIEKIDDLVHAFCTHMSYLTMCEQELNTQTLWLEDLDLSFLGVNLDVKKKPFGLNYEEFFTESQLEHVRRMLLDRKIDLYK